MKNNRLIIDLIVMTISVLLVCSNMNLSVFAEILTAETENISCGFTLDDDFADDCVLVVLTQEESIKFKEYTPTDFSEIGCKNIKGLATTKFNKGKNAVESIACAVNSNKEPIIDKSLDLSNYNNILCLELENPGKQNVLDAITELKKRDDVLFAEPNYTIRLMVDDAGNTASMTDDTELYYKYQLGLSDEINGRDARRLVNFEDPIIIGVIDSGISKERELRFQHSGYSVNFTIYDEYDSAIDYVPSDISNDEIDVKGHGTHVAGIIASTIDRYFYFETTNYTHISEFISVRTFYEDGTAELDNVICAIDYLNKRGVPIINFSAGAYLPFQYAYNDNSLKNAIENFDGLFVCAAGNGDINDNPVDLDTTPLFPAAWDMDNLISVGASNSSDELFDSSNFGNYTVDIFAPGENIYSCFPLGESFCDENIENCPNADTHISYGYHALSGTSMATAFVTGVAALVMQAYNENASPEDPDITPGDIKDYIMYSADDWAAAYENKCVCDGRLDAYAAVCAVLEDFDNTGDDGPCMHEARTYHYTSTTHTQYCASCGEQVGTPQTHGLMRMNESDPTYHTVMCLTCGYSANELHSASYNSIDSNRHLKYCTVCNYSGFENHDLYVQAVYDGDNGCDIACRDCSYSFHCDCNPEYGGGDATGHYAACPDGYYSLFEAHNYGQYTDLDNGNHSATCVDCGYTYAEAHTLRRFMSTDLYTHIVECTVCDYDSTESHTWVSYGTGYRCSVCKMLSDSPPIIMSLPDPELEAYLASLSVEELEEFIASLPEDQVERVTALLPSDDEHLTE
jgi:hypothetical protein